MGLLDGASAPSGGLLNAAYQASGIPTLLADTGRFFGALPHAVAQTGRDIGNAFSGMAQQGLQGDANFLRGIDPNTGQPAMTPYQRANVLAHWFTNNMGPQSAAGIALGAPGTALGSGAISKLADLAADNAAAARGERAAGSAAQPFSAMTGGTVLPEPIRAYHGSPYDFDAFDLSKVGTGEGAQAYGHGLYFAGNEDVARNYRDALAPNKLGSIAAILPDYFKPGNIVPSYGGQDKVLEFRQGASPWEFQAKVQAVNSRGEPIPGQPSRWHSTMPTQQNVQKVLGKPMGKMYEVAINADPNSMLDWDKPLSEQSPQVQQALALIRDYPTDRRGGAAYMDTGLALAKDAPVTQFQPIASRALADAGIPGIKYLDQGSRAAGHGSHNYVVFNPAIIDILRKYGIAGLLAGGTGALLNPQGQR